LSRGAILEKKCIVHPWNIEAVGAAMVGEGKNENSKGLDRKKRMLLFTNCRGKRRKESGTKHTKLVRGHNVLEKTVVRAEGSLRGRRGKGALWRQKNHTHQGKSPMKRERCLQGVQQWQGSRETQKEGRLERMGVRAVGNVLLSEKWGDEGGEKIGRHKGGNHDGVEGPRYRLVKQDTFQLFEKASVE